MAPIGSKSFFFLDSKVEQLVGEMLKKKVTKRKHVDTWINTGMYQQIWKAI